MRSAPIGTGAFRREMTAAERVPYTAHVSPTTVCTANGDLVMALRLGGASFETNDDAQLNNWHERLNVLWRNIASPNVALWAHTVRRHVRFPPVATTVSTAPFAEHLHTRYGGRLGAQSLLCNELILSLVFRPTSGIATGLVAKALLRTRHTQASGMLVDALDACQKLMQTMQASLLRYEPEPLGLYRDGARWYSSLLEHFAHLLNGEWQKIPVPCRPLNGALVTSRLLFGAESIEYRTPTATRVAAMLGIKEYSTPTSTGMYDSLLAAPFCFVLTQSFAFLSKAAGQSLLQRQQHRMANAGDFAVSQAAELDDALDALTSNSFVMGDHHLSLQVICEVAAECTDASHSYRRLQALDDAIATARSLLADSGMLVAREDLALEAGFWAQLPGNFAMRPRKAPITSRNFAAMVPFHNYPAGRESGNHWGAALCTLATRAGSPYHFSLHASDPSDPDGGSRKDIGHTLICGPTGSGKTVFVGFLICMLARQRISQIIFDKDRGLEILVRALDGEYLPLRSGVPTGCNPLQLPDDPRNVEFLRAWLRELAGLGADTHGPRQSLDLDQALRGTLSLAPAQRRLSRLVEFLDRTEPDGVHARLSRWCSSTGGEYAWVFDNPADLVVPRLTVRSVVGIDVTEFLGSAAIRAPLTLYLFHLVRQMLDGRRLVCWMDEFWRLLADKAFEEFAKDGPKTWRKLNAVMCLATQSPSDVLGSPIARTLIEQTPTKILFPNADANAADYRDGFGLSAREFKLIKEQIEPGSRQFLIKQGHHSVVGRLDLHDFDAELRVISGRTSALHIMQGSIDRCGQAAANWLPDFVRRTALEGSP